MLVYSNCLSSSEGELKNWQRTKSEAASANSALSRSLAESQANRQIASMTSTLLLAAGGVVPLMDKKSTKEPG